MATAPGTMRIGTAGWTIPRPCADEIAGSGTHLERYSRVFSCAEINSSFYRSHRLSTWQKWAASVPGNFRFAVKAPRSITHESKLSSSGDQLAAFLAEAQALGEHLGPLLFQLPPKLEFEEEKAEKFLRLLRSMHLAPVVFEPRHASWFTPASAQLLEQFDVARAAADPAIVAEAAEAGGSTKLIYHRMHGSPRRYYSAYGKDFIDAFAARLSHALPLSEVWCIFDNTASGAALSDALMMSRLLTAARASQLR